MSKSKHARPSRRAGREIKGGSLTFRATADMILQVQAAAVAGQRSVGDWLRLTIEKALEQAK